LLFLSFRYNTKTETGLNPGKGKTEKKRKNGNFSKTHGKVKTLILFSVSEHELPREENSGLTLWRQRSIAAYKTEI